MAVDQHLIEGAKDLLFQDYLDINVPLSSAQSSAALSESGDAFKSFMNKKYQQVGDGFKGVARGGGGKVNLVELCPNLQGGPGAPTKQRRPARIPEVTVEDKGKEDILAKPFSFDDFEKDRNGYAINPNVPVKDIEAFDQLLKDKLRTSARHYVETDSKGISDVPGGTKIMSNLFKGARNVLFEARRDNNTELEQKVTNDVVSFMKQMGAVKQAQSVFFEDVVQSQRKGSSSMGGGIYSAASRKENIRFMEQIYSGNAESSYVQGKLHFNVLNDEGQTVLVPYDEIDKNVILKDYESELTFVEFNEAVKANAAAGREFNEQAASGMLNRMLSDGDSIKEFILKDWVFDNKAGFNFKVWFENNFPMASLDFIHDPIKFESNAKQLKEAVIEYYVDMLKNEHNMALGKIGGNKAINTDQLKAFTKTQLQEISKKSQNLPD